MRKLITATLIAFAALAVAACGSTAVVTFPAAALAPWLARFATQRHPIQHACDWQVVSTKKNSYVCANPTVNWSAYNRLVIDSVEIASADMKRPLCEKEMEQLRKALLDSLNRRFESSAETPGRTLRIRATVIGVERSNKALNIVSLAAIQAPLSFGGATTKFELSDGETGEALGEVTLRGRGRVYDLISSVKPVGHAQKALERAPKQLSKNLDILRARFGTAQVATAGGEQ